MVSLSQVRASNSLISSTFSEKLVAVFVGGTSGIGEETAKCLAKYAKSSRIYIAGRSRDAGDRVLAECKRINPSGQYIFCKSDASLIRGADELCNEIKKEEGFINLLVMSQGVYDFSRMTSEGLHLLAALNYYSRIRIIQNLMPLLEQAPFLRRIVSVGGGGHEGSLDTADFQALNVPLENLREHLSTLVTLGLQAVATSSPEVSIVHGYPGTVKTSLLKDVPEETLKTMTFIPLEECGERHLYLATSSKYSPLKNEYAKIPLEDGVEVALGFGGQAGGVYSIREDCENASPEVMQKLAELRANGVMEEVWSHTLEQFARIEENYKKH
ncbi:hypothetical protein TRIATDRAFT_45904 [Trichoderma atroviride IMI 206040]|uniref:Short-chain dehydrogenase/reductase n=1 Tax=Hypocrea atroviridis (strain ATCC 20476 / IMI 206040) TaxID=452589 RepID=G9NR43_HYPAI|nr:uncharacterized protein TRIATDRAFT_45904 [Trichoderma atroviride IMI 206040]EHK47013.1 hypothetical protein TRIATDRAFT_45904 [Trichoderma atroviride IMI 206040]